MATLTQSCYSRGAATISKQIAIYNMALNKLLVQINPLSQHDATASEIFF